MPQNQCQRRQCRFLLMYHLLLFVLVTWGMKTYHGLSTGECKTWTLDSGLDSWTGLWTGFWTQVRMRSLALCRTYGVCSPSVLTQCSFPSQNMSIREALSILYTGVKIMQTASLAGQLLARQTSKLPPQFFISRNCIQMYKFSAQKGHQLGHPMTFLYHHGDASSCLCPSRRPNPLITARVWPVRLLYRLWRHNSTHFCLFNYSLIYTVNYYQMNARQN